MKLLGKIVAPNQPGTVKLILEDPDDLWLAYNIIAAGDRITSETSRKVYHSSDSGAGSGKNSTFRVKLNMQITVTAVDYDKDSTALRVRGRSLTDNEYINSGAFHTLELEMKKEFDLEKKIWSGETIDALQDGCNRESAADLAVVLMHDRAAHVYLIGERATTLCATIDGCKNNKKGSEKFFENLFRAFTTHIDFEFVRCVVIGSPNSLNSEFRVYLLSEAQKKKSKSISDNKARIVLVNANSLKEILHDTTVMSSIKDTKVAMEIQAMKELTEILSSDPDRACYGPKSVEAAQDMMAIKTLMIIDELFRSGNIETREKHIGLVKSVKEAGGNALVLSSMHVAGEQLLQLTGIAAILRFPVPGLDEVEV